MIVCACHGDTPFSVTKIRPASGSRRDRFRLCIPERLPPPRGPLESSSSTESYVIVCRVSGGDCCHETGVGTSCVRESNFVKGLVGSLFVSGARPVRTCSVRHSCALDLIVCISLAQTLPGGSLKSSPYECVCVSVWIIFWITCRSIDRGSATTSDGIICSRCDTTRSYSSSRKSSVR